MLPEKVVTFMRKPVLYPVLALGLGALTAGARMWQHTAGYDESGLPVPYALPTLLLSAFLGICAGAFLYLALRQPKALADQKPALPRGNLAAGLFTGAGVLILAGGAVNLLAFSRSYLAFSQTLYAYQHEQQEALRAFLSNHLMTGVTGLAAFPAAAALLVRAKRSREEAEAPKPFVVMMPSVFCWLWLIRDFRLHTSNPILWDYVLLLLAIVVLLVSAYERAGFAFGVGKPRRTVFTSLSALTLALAALPDCGGAANALTLLALALHAAAELPSLLSALENAPAESETPHSIQQEDAPHEQ